MVKRSSAEGKDIVYRLLQEPTLDNFRNFLKGQTGEHNSIDFKEKWIEPTKLVKEMLAIANSGGGIIIFGVKEKEDKSFSLQEIFSRSNPVFKDWLQWNDTEYKFEDNLKFNEFLSWLYPRNEENVLDGVEVKGNWDNRLIKRSNDIRIVSFLLRESISDFEMFRADGDLEKAQNSANTRKYLESQDPSTETLEKIKSCTI